MFTHNPGSSASLQAQYVPWINPESRSFVQVWINPEPIWPAVVTRLLLSRYSFICVHTHSFKFPFTWTSSDWIMPGGLYSILGFRFMEIVVWWKLSKIQDTVTPIDVLIHTENLLSQNNIVSETPFVSLRKQSCCFNDPIVSIKTYRRDIVQSILKYDCFLCETKGVSLTGLFLVCKLVWTMLMNRPQSADNWLGVLKRILIS